KLQLQNMHFLEALHKCLFCRFCRSNEKSEIDAAKSRATTGHIVMKSMMLAAIPYSRGGFETSVDFFIGFGFLDYLKDVEVDYFILCPSEKVCGQRAGLQKEGGTHDHEFSEIGQFEKYAIRNDADAGELARI